MKVTLVRVESFTDGVFGLMELPGGLTLHTVEDDWKDNQRNESCIPNGEYELVRTIYHKHKIETFEVVDVPNRDRCLVHTANTEEDVQGCIGVGMRPGTFSVVDEDDPQKRRKNKRGVVDSRIAFGKFMEALSQYDRIPFGVYWAKGLP
jgi:uncharacterized protein DUF5675